MWPVSWRRFGVAAILVVGWLGGGEVAAQGLGGASSGGAVSPGPAAAAAGVPMSSATAPIVMTDPTGSSNGHSASGGVLGDPLTAPLLYNSLLQASRPQGPGPANALYGPTGLATTQLGLLLLANRKAGGIGSGRISGTRPDPRGSGGDPGAARDTKQRTLARPGGLASRYFNRVGPHAPYPRNYFNRRPRYFP